MGHSKFTRLKGVCSCKDQSLTCTGRGIMGKGEGKGSGKGSGGFSDDQLEMYRECFKLMDVDKDGVINKNDLRAAFDNIGSLMSEQELDSMLGEIGGPCNYENMVKCFETKMSGFVNDPDDLVVGAFKSYNEESYLLRSTAGLRMTFSETANSEFLCMCTYWYLANSAMLARYSRHSSI